MFHKAAKIRFITVYNSVYVITFKFHGSVLQITSN